MTDLLKALNFIPSKFIPIFPISYNDITFQQMKYPVALCKYDIFSICVPRTCPAST